MGRSPGGGADRTSPPSREAGTSLRTLERGLSVFEFVVKAGTPVKMREIAEAAGLNTTTTYHVVNTLRSMDYLVRNESGLVEAGPAIAWLFRAYEQSGAQQAALLKTVEDLARHTGETAYVTQAQHSGVSIQAVFEGTKSLRVGGLEVGYQGSEHRRASGKAVLAHLGESQRSALLDARLIDVPIAERSGYKAELDQELAQIAALGRALDDGNFEPGVCCVAVPYFGRGRQVRGAIALSAPTLRSELLFGQYADLVVEAAAQASALLGAGDEPHAR